MKLRLPALLIAVALFSQAVLAAQTDWSRAVVDSTMKRYPTAESLKGWGYAKSLYLYGEYLVYLRTKDPRYLRHVRDWVDLHIDDKGTINRPINALDYMLPGNLCLVLYKETKQPKYKGCADNIRKVFDTYPRTKDGAFWHADTKSRAWQNWADGVFMSLPFLVRYGKMFGDSKYTDAEAVKQLLLYYQHLNDPATGLLWHAYDESGEQKWADPKTHHSAEHWARAIGWYAMTLINVLDIIPKNQPHRDELIKILQQLAGAFEKYQDKNTGLWYQVVDKGSVPGNWLETSASSMYTYALWMGLRRGYLDKHFKDVALKGYKGVLRNVSIDKEGLTDIVDISEGTNVSDIAYYLARKRNTNDFHGIGAFLIMNEQLRTSEGGKAPNLDWTAKSNP
ncbi:MAG TPA: glycoside hydrolase family 88 protein [Pyrinomonadaceae bacterium]|jgi:unsaturated rhamnogalacturonyl hydrolase|nr:glycoside hydrolase family 88 protein [Pyrinomonadaceae bacterium]